MLLPEAVLPARSPPAHRTAGHAPPDTAARWTWKKHLLSHCRGCKFGLADHTADLDMIRCEEFCASSPLCHDMFWMLFPGFEGFERLKLCEAQGLTILCCKKF